MTNDEAMGRALALAAEAAADGEVPVGAVVLDAGGRVIGEGRNARGTQRDSGELFADDLRLIDGARTTVGGLTADCVHDVSRAEQLAKDTCLPEHGTDSDSAVVHDDVGTGEMHETRAADPLAHAEVLAMRDAARRLGNWNLADCTLVVTLEPCPMCAGACVQTHIGRIVFGAWDAKLGACGSVWDIPRDPHVGHVPEVYGGVREADCARILADFFALRR
ncbi:MULTISPECIES: nucleoside deaminase [Bifidobacterium]|uniref:nucleoside deaminase n=1 Tax=Bifidobacterium TaxID=1678 RepID=UPI001BDD299E|nr:MULTISPECIES: nucleoside deaminase [Bifidobacterium]MBT1162254.1 nucleoside deaminase [Bifidobacterium sp. SO1]MBW3079165.1 nucleoside deaminase [Bifidobacterium simiiventris]